jgi:hypothetical protein
MLRLYSSWRRLDRAVPWRDDRAAVARAGPREGPARFARPSPNACSCCYIALFELRRGRPSRGRGRFGSAWSWRRLSRHAFVSAGQTRRRSNTGRNTGPPHLNSGSQISPSSPSFSRETAALYLTSCPLPSHPNSYFRSMSYRLRRTSPKCGSPGIRSAIDSLRMTHHLPPSALPRTSNPGITSDSYARKIKSRF